MATDPRWTLGRLGEQLAAEHFARRGCRLLARNHQTRFGELDLVVADGETLVFCEVKTGRAGRIEPWDNLHDAKRSQVRRMASAWLNETPRPAVLHHHPLRRRRRARRRGRSARPARTTSRARSDARPPRGAPPRPGPIVIARVNTFAVDGVASPRVSGSRSTSAEGLPASRSSGCGDAAVRESRERVRAAIGQRRIRVPAAAGHGQPRAGAPASRWARASISRSPCGILGASGQRRLLALPAARSASLGLGGALRRTARQCRASPRRDRGWAMRACFPRECAAARQRSGPAFAVRAMRALRRGGGAR